MYKSHLFLNFQIFRERISFTASFVEHPVYSNYKMESVLILVVLFWLVTISPKCMYKSKFFLKLLVLRERSSFIAFFVYRAFPKCILILYFHFDLSLFKRSVCIKVIYSWIFKCFAKEAVLLLLSWSTQYIAFPKCVTSWF